MAAPTTSSAAPERALARSRVALLGSLACIGFTAVIAQIVLTRELIVVFYGNEISLGLILATWLLGTAAGTTLLGRFDIATWGRRRVVAGLQVALAVVFPATVLAARASRALFQPTPGEILGPGAVLLICLLSLAVFCSLSGWLFAAGSRLYAHEAATGTADASGAVYLLEAVGSAAGGLLASTILVRYGTGLQIALAVGMANLLSAVVLAVKTPAGRRVLGTAAIAVTMGLLWISPTLESASLQRLWPGFRLVATRHSIYGHLAVVEHEGARSLYENGLVAFTGGDRSAAEEAVHFALLQHPAPVDLLLIGGGVNGSVGEALKHPSLRHVDYVELDPEVIAVTRDFFPEQWQTLADPRVQVHTVDGRLFLNTTTARYDVIVVNVPDPQNAQLNRFYTREFFAEAARKLRDTGLLSFAVHGSEDYLSPAQVEFLACLQRTLREVFPAVLVLPGEMVHFSAAKHAGALSADASLLIARLHARHIATLYVSEYYLPFRLSAERTRGLEEQIRPEPGTRVNRDFAPVAYYFGVALWSAQFRAELRDAFLWLAQVRFATVLAVTLVLGLGIAWWIRRLSSPRRRSRAGAAFCVGAMGLTGMALEVLLLLGFQAIYGYVYYQLAVVIAGFMVGMAVGSWWARAAVAARPEPRTERMLPLLQIIAAVSPLLLYVALVAGCALTGAAATLMISHLAFPMLALAAGLLGGYQFQVASRVYFGVGDARSPGWLYSVDLLGASLGALLVSAYLVPVFGMLRTAGVIAVVNVVPAWLAAFPASADREPPPPAAAAR